GFGRQGCRRGRTEGRAAGVDAGRLQGSVAPQYCVAQGFRAGPAGKEPRRLIPVSLEFCRNPAPCAGFFFCRHMSFCSYSALQQKPPSGTNILFISVRYRRLSTDRSRSASGTGDNSMSSKILKKIRPGGPRPRVLQEGIESQWLCSATRLTTLALDLRGNQIR